jgi:hypothetical protein
MPWSARAESGRRGHRRTRAQRALSPREYARAMAVSADIALIDLRELLACGLVQAVEDRRYSLSVDKAPRLSWPDHGTSNPARTDEPNSSP